MILQARTQTETLPDPHLAAPPCGPDTKGVNRLEMTSGMYSEVRFGTVSDRISLTGTCG